MGKIINDLSSKLFEIRWLHISLIIAVILFNYLQISSFDFNLDDEIVINENTQRAYDWSSITDIFTSNYFDNDQFTNYGYRPITSLSFYLQNVFGIQSSQVSHAISLCLFLAISLIIYFLSIKISNNGVVSFLLTLLFAIHPIYSEVVCSIKNRDELLAMLFILLSFNFLRSKNFLLVVLFAILSVLSKKSGIGLIITFPIIAAYFFEWKPIKVILLTAITSMILMLSLPTEQLSKLILISVTYLGGISIFFIHIFIHFKKFKVELLKYFLILLTLITFLFSLFQFQLISFVLILCGLFTYHIFKADSLISQFLVLMTCVLTFFIKDWMPLLILPFIIASSQLGSRSKNSLYALITCILLYHQIWSFNITNLIVLGFGIIFLIPVVFQLTLQKVQLKVFISVVAVSLFISLLIGSRWSLVLFICTVLIYSILILTKSNRTNWILWTLPLFLIISILHPKTVITHNNYVEDQIIELTTVQNEGRELHQIENPLINQFIIKNQILSGLNTFGFYIGKYFFPYSLSSYYGFDTLNLFDLGSAAFWLIFICLITTILIYWKKWKILAAFLVFYISLFPFSNVIVPVAGIVGERLIFIPSLALTVFIILVGSEFKGKYRWVTVSIFSLWLSFLTFKTYSRVPDWKNKESLFLNDIKHQPRSVKLNELVGDWYLFESQIERELALKNAAEYYQNAASIYPDYDRSWFMLGQIREEQNQPVEALKVYLKVKDYSYVGLNYYLITGICAMKANQFAIADDYLKKAISIEETEYDAYLNLINLYMKAGNVNLALSASKKALSVFPANKQLIESHLKLSMLANNSEEMQLAEDLLKKLN